MIFYNLTTEMVCNNLNLQKKGVQNCQLRVVHILMRLVKICSDKILDTDLVKCENNRKSIIQKI